MSIEENVAARKRAREFLALQEGQESEHFWRCLSQMALERIPNGPPPKVFEERNPPMTERQAIAFEAEEMTFGKHEGRIIGCINPEYLVWLVDGDRFINKLEQYVKSDRFKQRMRDEC